LSTIRYTISINILTKGEFRNLRQSSVGFRNLRIYVLSAEGVLGRDVVEKNRQIEHSRSLYLKENL